MKRALRLFAVLVVAVPGGLSLLGSLQKPLELPPGVAGQYASLSDCRIRYVQKGAGADVLLLHGSPGSVEDWAPIFDRLAQRYRVTAYDRPGHGYSSGWMLPHTPEGNARVALELIRALALTDVLVVGHSYGGVTALRMAVENPKEIRAFVVVGTTRAYEAKNIQPIYRVAGIPYLGPGFTALVGSRMGRSKVPQGIRRAFSPNEDAIPPRFLELRLPIWTHPTVVTTLAQERLTLDRSLRTMSPQYGSVSKRVYLVQGALDQGTPESAKKLAKDLPNARLVLLEGAGHYVQYARPDELLHVIDEAMAAR